MANPGIHNARGGKPDVGIIRPYYPTEEQLAGMTDEQRAGFREFKPVTETKEVEDDD